MPRVVLTLLAATLVTFLTLSTTSEARAETVVESSTVENGYPANLTFKLTARADTEITDVSLSYSIAGRGTGALDKPKTLTPARNLSTEVVIQVNSANSYFPVGSDFSYRWQITTADGNTYTSPDQKFFYLPPGRDWKSVANDFMVVYYHGDRESLANQYLRAGAETYERIGRQLYGIELKQVPVKVIMFADEAESNPARPGSGGRFDAAVTTCGTKVTNDIVLVIPVACGSADRTDTLRHEFGHILNETAGEGSLAKLPSWLDEGAAVYAQSTPGDYRPAVDQAIQARRIIPFSEMGIPATNPNQVQLYYGQSWAMVSFLIEEGGPETFAKFMSTIKGGRRVDQALSDVYGFANMTAFEDSFKASVGISQQAQPATPAAQATPGSQASPAPQATATPTPGVPATADDSSGDGEVSNETLLIGGIGVLFALGAVLAFLVSTMMRNNRKAAARNAAAGGPSEQQWSPPDGPDRPIGP